MGYIYKITNDINGKVYIGKTDFTIEERWKSHLHDWKTKIELEKRPLYNAFNKYGVEHFHIEQLEENDNNILNEREQYWINYYRSYVGFSDCNGYNATLGGDGASYFNYSDEEVIERYKELKTVLATAQYFNCDFDTISIRLKRNNINPNSLENKRIARGKKVQALDILNNNVIKEFNSQTAAAEWLNEISQLNGSTNTTAANIGRCCNGIRQSYGGYKWRRI